MYQFQIPLIYACTSLCSLVPTVLEVVAAKLPLESPTATARQRKAARSLAAPVHADVGEEAPTAQQTANLLLKALRNGELHSDTTEAEIRNFCFVLSYFHSMALSCCVAAGASTERDNVSVLAAHTYRAILMVLPASVHTWFSDIRDRGKTQAVEAYTKAHESPALLKHELSVLQVRWQLSLSTGLYDCLLMQALGITKLGPVTHPTFLSYWRRSAGHTLRRILASNPTLQRERSWQP